MSRHSAATLAVGDHVRTGCGLRYVILAIDGGYAWLRVAEGENHIARRVSELVRA